MSICSKPTVTVVDHSRLSSLHGGIGADAAGLLMLAGHPSSSSGKDEEENHHHHLGSLKTVATTLVVVWSCLKSCLTLTKGGATEEGDCFKALLGEYLLLT